MDCIWQLRASRQPKLRQWKKKSERHAPGRFCQPEQNLLFWHFISPSFHRSRRSMSCLEIQEAPGRQAVCAVQAGRPETGQAVCIQQPGESPLQQPETLFVRQQEEAKFIMGISLQKTGKTLPFFLSYEKEKQGVTKREAVSPAVYRRAVFVLY